MLRYFRIFDLYLEWNMAVIQLPLNKSLSLLANNSEASKALTNHKRGTGFQEKVCIHGPIRTSLCDFSRDRHHETMFTIKAALMTNLLLISAVRSSSEDDADRVEQKHGTHCCQDNKVLGFSEVTKLTKDRFEFNFVRLHKEIATKSGQMIAQAQNAARNCFRHNLERGRKNTPTVITSSFYQRIIEIIFLGKRR